MAERIYPVDRLTGLPYSVVPFEASDRPDTNHVAFHSDNPLLQGLAGLAVRFARVQEMDRGEHELLHERYGSMQRLPETTEEQFEYCLWAALGDIPPFAVDLSRRNHWVVELDSSQISTLRNRDVRIDSNEIMGKFFSEYVQRQELPYIDEADIAKHLYTPFMAKKPRKGEWLLREAAEAAVAPLQEKYRRLRRDGRIAVKPHTNLSNIVISKIAASQRQEFVKRKRHTLTIQNQLSRIGLETLQTGVDELQSEAA